MIEALLFDAAEAGVPIASLIDAFGRRFGPWCETDRGRPGKSGNGDDHARNRLQYRSRR